MCAIFPQEQTGSVRYGRRTMTARHVFFTGRVQGVGFRYATKRIAMGFDVIGWVCNLPDGRVELLVGGDEEEEVDAFLEEIRVNSELSHHILECEDSKVPPSSLEGIRGFAIRA